MEVSDTDSLDITKPGCGICFIAYTYLSQRGDPFFRVSSRSNLQTGGDSTVYIIDPFLRSGVYRELASWYRYPEKSSLKEMKTNQAEITSEFEALASHGNLALTSRIRDLFEALEDLLLEEVQSEYVRLFDYRPSCPMFESSYIAKGKRNPGEVKLSVEESYNEFGLETSSNFKEPPDHIMLELEFMHFLCFREGESLNKDSGNKHRYIEGQRRFCENHILTWVPDFCDRVEKNANELFFGILAALTKDFLIHDVDYMNALCRN